ncbi:MAG: hypothetical protein V3U95_02185 [Dehalococcoidia bacterium]|nr:hypothetical protein [Chloroflexota bacterium]MCZ6867167.1 hypothetical protein [Chloroflexota bacterium]
MVSVPSFILRRLYVKGSLLSTDAGMEFQLLNRLGSGYARRLLPLTLDGHDIPLDCCEFHVDGSRVPFANISRENTFTIALNKLITVTAKGVTLTKEPHNIGMAFEVAGLGVLKFDFTDTPSDG